MVRSHRRGLMVMLVQRPCIPHLQPTMYDFQHRVLVRIAPSRRQRPQGPLIRTGPETAAGGGGGGGGRFPFDDFMGHTAMRRGNPGKTRSRRGRLGTIRFHTIVALR